MDNSDSSRRHDEEAEFNLREWHLKARRENTTNSRRYSASYVGNATIREGDNYINSRSFRSNFTISSTASSPGYNHLRDNEIDPSTYSFTTALKALQGRSAGHVWECLSPEGFALNSKWDEAERYICNPLSGQVPVECLSAKTLSGRSFHSLVAYRITTSAPVVYSAKPRRRSSKPPAPIILLNDNINNNTINEEQQDKGHVPTTPTTQEVTRKAMIGSKTRDVGTQSSPPPDHRSSSSSPATSSFSPSLRRPVRHEDKDEHGLVSTSRTNISSSSEQVKLKEKDETMKEDEEGKGEDQAKRNNMQVQKVKTGKHCRCRQYAGCLLSFKNLWMRKRQTEKHKSKSTTAIFFHHCLNITEY